MQNSWVFIVNSTAGNGKTGKKINSLIRHLTRFGLNYQIELSRFHQHAIEIAKNACQKGYQNIIAVGGDGTASQVATGIVHADATERVSFGILPEGGGNDFCRNFHQSHSLEKSLLQLISGKTIKIDLASIDDFYFLNSFGIGFDAQVAVCANRITFLNGLLRYLVAIGWAMFKFRNLPMRLIIDDKEEYSGKYLLVALGNGKYAGGGFKITPEALIDDDFLDLMLAENVSFLRVFSVLPKVLNGKHESEREISFLRCQKLEVISDLPLPIYFDGEIPQLKKPNHFTIQITPQKLNLIVPTQ